MLAALSTSAFLSLRVLALAGLLMAPVGALAYSKANGAGIGKLLQRPGAAAHTKFSRGL